MNKKKILITGAAGFIGFHLVEKFLKCDDFVVIGLDNINEYYDIRLKYMRLREHGINGSNLSPGVVTASSKYSNYCFIKSDIVDHDFIVNFMVKEKFDYVINLAAQAGVRYSIDNPQVYVH